MMDETTTSTATPILGSSAETMSSTTIAPPAAAPSATGAPAPEAAKVEAPKPDPRLGELEAKLAAQQAAIEAQRADALAMLADRLGVLPQYRGYLPQVDPFSEKGKAELQKWASEHPEIVRPAAPVAPIKSDEFEAKLARFKANPLVNFEAWRAAEAARRGEAR